jgi:hypothetical protein
MDQMERLLSAMGDSEEQIAAAKTISEVALPAFTGITRLLVAILKELDEIKSHPKSY